MSAPLRSGTHDPYTRAPPSGSGPVRATISEHDDFRGDTAVVHLTARPKKNIAHKKRGCATRNTCTVL
jgi:hypothetical protein